MSFFISSIDAPGLMSRPPVSKHTPLPTSVTFGCDGVAPFDVDQPRRDRRCASDGVNRGEAFLQQVVADDHAMARAVAACDIDGRLRQRLGRHVVRGRVDEIARERSSPRAVARLLRRRRLGQAQLQSNARAGARR